MKREEGWTRTFSKCSLTSLSTSMRISSSRTPRRGAIGGPSQMKAEHLRIVLDIPSCTNLLVRQQHEQFPSTCGGLCVSCHLPLPDLLQTDFQNSPTRPFYESGDKLHDQRPHFENLPKLTNPVAMLFVFLTPLETYDLTSPSSELPHRTTWMSTPTPWDFCVTHISFR